MRAALVFSALAVAAFSAIAQEDAWTRGYVWNAAANSGTDVWFGPGNKVTTTPPTAYRTVSGSGTALNVAEQGSIALRDGRSVVLKATRSVAASEVLAGVSRLASGPYGIAAALALPFFIDWVAGDNQSHIRIKPDGSGLEIKDPSVCTANCKEYQQPNTNTWFPTLVQACQAGAATASTPNPAFTQTYFGTSGALCVYAYKWGTTDMGTGNVPVNSRSRVPDTGGWLPASMDDIAPYMTPRQPPTTAVDVLTSKGLELDSTPVAVETVTPPPAKAPYTRTTQYPAPPVDTTTTTTPGNPQGLAPNTPTVTSTTTGSRPVSPGSSTSTGPAPSPNPDPGPINSPTTTKTTSTYDPATNQTTSTTTTTTAPQTVTQTTTNVTNITNTTNTSNVTNTTTTVTNTTNNTTNTTTTTTNNNQTPNTDPNNPEPTKTQCEKTPDIIGCAKFGDPENPTLPKSTKPFVLTVKDFGGGGSCPAPLSFTVKGLSYSVAFQPICDQLVFLKALMLMLAGVMAAYILADSFKVG